MSPSALQLLRANTKSTQIFLIVALLAAVLIMTACGSSHASSMLNPNANSAASGANAQGGSGSGNSGSGDSKPEVMIIGDYVPELPAPSGQVYSYSVNLNNGTISQVGSNFDNGTGALAVNHANTLLYTREIGPTMAVYSIGSSGTLNLLFNTVNIRAHSFEGRIAIHPNDHFVYCGSYTEGVIGYRAQSDGTMTELPGNPIQPESFMAGFSSSGTFLYGVSAAPPSVIAYPVNSQTGTVMARARLVTPVATANGQFTLGDVQLDPLGKFLFVTDQANNAIYTFSIEGGKAQQVATTSTGSETPGNLTITPSDTLLYMGSASNPDILGFSISQNGMLSPLNGGKAFTLGSLNFGPIQGLKADLSGRFLYANTFFYTNGMAIDPKTGNLNQVVAPILDQGNALTDVTFANLP